MSSAVVITKEALYAAVRVLEISQIRREPGNNLTYEKLALAILEAASPHMTPTRASLSEAP
jgi:hypothetical protein